MSGDGPDRSLDELRTDALFHLSRRFNRALARPDWVSVNLTLRCNLSCSFCHTCYEVEHELTTDEVRSVIAQAADWGVPVFNPLGGEPLLRKDLAELLWYADRRGFHVSLTTNGTLLRGRRIRELAPIPKLAINVSVDGLRDSHDHIRGKGTFDRIVANLEAYRGHERAEGLPRTHLGLNCVIHARNLGELIDVIELAKRLDLDRVQFLFLTTHEGKTDGIRDLIVDETALPRLDRAVDELANHIARDDSGFQYTNTVEDVLLAKEFYRGRLHPEQAVCFNGFKELYVNADGAVLMCDGNLDFLAESAGNVREQSLREIWTGEQARRMRRKVLACRRGCLQDCYLRHDSERLRTIAWRAARAGWRRLQEGRR